MSTVLHPIQHSPQSEEPAEPAGQTSAHSSPLGKLVTQYLAVLSNERGSSPHTLRAYERELRSFVLYIIENLGQDTAPSAIEHTRIRAWLGSLYERGLSKASAARALAAVRSWFRWLARFGHVHQNAASLVATPKLREMDEHGAPRAGHPGQPGAHGFVAAPAPQPGDFVQQPGDRIRTLGP